MRRYKRFLADIALEADGREVTAHCANPGSMMGLAEAGSRIWVEPNTDAKKKLKYGWRLVDHENGHFTGVDTSAANRVLKQALIAGAVPGLEAPMVRAEVKFGTRSRVDFLLSGAGPETYVEVKSVTLSRQTGLAEFPDSVTARGLKHLEELSHVAQNGARAVMFYLVQRTDCERVTIARDIDPAYAAGLKRARTAGVEVMATDCRISPEEICLGRMLPFVE